MKHLHDMVARVFFRLAYRALLSLWFFTKPTVYGVYIAIWYNAELLIIKNSYRKRLTIPCGRIKPGEDLAEAAVRELYEEVGIKLEKSQLSFIGEYAGNFKNATDIGSFFEIDMAEMPRVHVDNREVIWAQFMSLERISKLHLNPTVGAWLDNR
jgi:8-oxo-dGTP pyrophosphatase MutT (NUDIX family)